MTMDKPSVENSPPPSEHTTESWGQSWDIDDSSIAGLHIEPTHELSSMVEDKELAARAVAFVVSSSRKGVVPLCAEVANLLKAKRCLERKLTRVKNENQVLRRSSNHLVSLRSRSHSSSPTPQSLQSYAEPAPYSTGKCSPTCSRCSSQSSSLLSISPKLDKRQRSPRLHRTSAFTPSKKYQCNTADQPFTNCGSNIDHMIHGGSHLGHMNHEYDLGGSGDGGHLESEVIEGQQCVIVAEVHSEAEGDGMISETIDKSRGASGTCLDRKNSLPEITNEPLTNIPKVSPRSTVVSSEVQCSLENEEFQLTKTKLTAELEAAHKEIEALKVKLQAVSVQEPASVVYHEENEVLPSMTLCSCQGEIKKTPPPTISCHGHPSTVWNKLSRSNSDGNPRTKSGLCRSQTLILPPLEGCGCRACERANAPVSTVHSHRVGFSCDQTLLSARVMLDLEDGVVIDGEPGIVKYLGHIDNFNQSQPYSICVGVVFDNPVGSHDGTHQGKRYFTSPPNCAIFAPLEDIECVISKKASHKVHPNRPNSPGRKCLRQDSIPKLSLTRKCDQNESSHVV